jgi:hypothetical protein
MGIWSRAASLVGVVALSLVLGGCGDDGGGGSTVPSAPSQVFAVGSPIMVFGVGVADADGYRLYQSGDGINWTQDPASAIIMDGDPDFYPSRIFGFFTGNSTTDTYYMVHA